MMSVFMSLFFMILFSSFLSWYFVLIFIMFLFFYIFMYFPLNMYYSMLSYFLGGDLLSFSLVMLSFWIVFLMIMSSSLIYKNNNNTCEFIFVNLFLLLMLFLSFSVYNIFMYYFFFECSLVPILILIFGWGYQPERLMAGYYMLFYTMFFSMPMLLGIFYINFSCFSMFYFLINVDFNIYLYFSMIMAFLAKMPMLFLHFWLPKAHVEAPVSGSMVLAGVLLKLGGYGILRVFIFLKNYEFNLYFVSLSLFGMFMVGVLCMFQIDMKSLIAYSSVAHMGMVICGMMCMNYLGIIGSLVLMIGHGLCSSGMFCLANISYERTHSRSLFINKGLLNFMPNMCLFWFLLMVNNMSSPPSMNLLGEILLINSIMSWSSLSFLYLMFASFMGCMYSVYLYSCVNHGLIHKGVVNGYNGYYIEYYLLFLHWLPLNIFVLKIDLVSLMV
uniref:NADH-ubiquinone oxidoreductase chain 4 n=1 Tax=Hyalopeplus sp. TaxID=2931294 RepID=A0A8T9ZY02_9HEMI|nr:NADH dehydrogenase subunit 4 [Hyalopeplus sp.]